MVEVITVGPEEGSPLAFERFVRMRDGVRLATDVYVPAGDDGAGDTVLIRLPYDKNGRYTFLEAIAEYFMARGYRVVAQDVRGKFRSEGEALLFVNEVEDGYDTIEWITQQEWSNGRVAMWGDSYFGFTQWAAVAGGHPALKAISPRVTGTMLGEPVRPVAGEPTTPVEWSVTLLYPMTMFHSQRTYYWDMDWSRRPFSEQVEEVVEQIGARSISYDQWFPHPVHLRRWRSGHPFDARPVPTLHTIGWWDNCAPLSWADVEKIEARPSWALNHFLRVESMDHEGHYLLEADADRVVERTPEQIRAALPRMLDPTLDFFEVFVRGNGSVAEIPRVCWNLAGTEGMREGELWPPTGTRPARLFATAEGALTVDAPVDAAEATWVHDPQDLVPSTASDAFAFLIDRPDEVPVGARSDVLVFTTKPVAATVDLAGPVTATLTAGSDGPNMDVFVRLVDLAPDGTGLRIARGQVHVVDASSPTRVTIDLGQVGYRLRAGHRLRVHVSSSDFPEFVPQPGTGENGWSAVETRANRQHLTLGGSEPFFIDLPILEGTLP